MEAIETVWVRRLGGLDVGAVAKLLEALLKSIGKSFRKGLGWKVEGAKIKDKPEEGNELKQSEQEET